MCKAPCNEVVDKTNISMQMQYPILMPWIYVNLKNMKECSLP